MSSPHGRRVLALALVAGWPLLVSSPAAQREPIVLIPAPSATARGALPLSPQEALAHFRARIASEGEMSIIVEVRVPAVPEGVAAAGQTIDETSVIAEVQRRVMRRLPAQTHEVRPSEVIPFIALVADARTFEILLSDSDVISIQEDFAVPPALADSVPLVQATVAWGKGYAGRGISVAVLDTGVEKKHAIFRDGIIAEACYSGGGKKSNSLCRNGALASTASNSAAPCTYSSRCDHGTHVAAIVAGYTGVAPAAWLIAMQVFSKSNGEITSWSTDWVKALERVYTLRTKYSIAAVNMSIGGEGFTKTCDSQSRALVSIVKKLYDARIAVVVASGNDHYYNGISFPGCLSQVVSVGNATKSNKVNSSSNAASFLRLLAPGTASGRL